MRGEHEARQSERGQVAGSSPLARGTHRAFWLYCRQLRIIPACAGNTSDIDRLLQIGADHPRLRGEHSGCAWTGTRLPGSSPLARGTRIASLTRASRCRIIPACAGNTEQLTVTTPPREDHPRLRGEHFSRPAMAVCTRGSSPLARGTPQSFLRYAVRTRIIPACAGNTQRRERRHRPRWDHPRLRGEHTTRRGRHRRGSGSSPLARGTRAGGGAIPATIGIIPACAGNTRCWRRFAPHAGDHPRLRGEHT